MRAPAADHLTDCGEHHCITCGDDGVPMTVVDVGRDGLATCAGADGARSRIEVALVEPVSPGDTVLVHAGTALLRLEAAA